MSKASPKYREAYPRLDVQQACLEQRRGRDICVFRTEKGYVAGDIRFELSGSGDDALLKGHLSYKYFAPWSEGLQIRLTHAPSSVRGLRRAAAACPSCGQRRRILIYKDWWACGECHKLHYRRQLVDCQTLAAEDFVEAERRLAIPRPRGMHQKTFAERRAADEKLITRLRPIVGAHAWRRVASAAHQLRIESTWMTLDDFRYDEGLRLFASDFEDLNDQD